MSSLNCIVIDDDEIDRLMIVSLVKNCPQLALAGSYESAEEALAKQDFSDIDVLLLDIDMPGGISGIEFRKTVNDVPACIFITAYPEYALDSFSVETLDFIVKPLKKERFDQVVGKLVQFMTIRAKARLYENHIGGDFIYIREGHQETKVNLHEILYLEALKDYTLIITNHKRHCVLMSIGNLLKEQAFRQFVRIHRSFAVKKELIKSKSAHKLVLENGTALPVGRSFSENLSMI